MVTTPTLLTSGHYIISNVYYMIITLELYLVVYAVIILKCMPCSYVTICFVVGQCGTYYKYENHVFITLLL
jgi:hypothetical protein